MKTDPDKIYGSQKKKAVKKTATKKQKAQLSTENIEEDAPLAVKDVDSILKVAPKAAFPKEMYPMLATLVDEPFDDPDWEFEIKWDGYRAITFRNDRLTEIRSRNEKSFNDKFYPVYDAVKRWNIKAVVDGEIVVVE